jgi:hypothetical protein
MMKSSKQFSKVCLNGTVNIAENNNYCVSTIPAVRKTPFMVPGAKWPTQFPEAYLFSGLFQNSLSVRKQRLRKKTIATFCSMQRKLES